MISIICHRNEQIPTSQGCKIQGTNPVCQEHHLKFLLFLIHFFLTCSEWSYEEQECTDGFVAVPCSPAQAKLGIRKVVNA